MGSFHFSLIWGLSIIPTLWNFYFLDSVWIPRLRLCSGMKFHFQTSFRIKIIRMSEFWTHHELFKRFFLLLFQQVLIKTVLKIILSFHHMIHKKNKNQPFHKMHKKNSGHESFSLCFSTVKPAICQRLQEQVINLKFITKRRDLKFNSEAKELLVIAKLIGHVSGRDFQLSLDLWDLCSQVSYRNS